MLPHDSGPAGLSRAARPCSAARAIAVDSCQGVDDAPLTPGEFVGVDGLGGGGAVTFVLEPVRPVPAPLLTPDPVLVVVFGSAEDG